MTENTTLLLDPDTHDLVFDDGGAIALIHDTETTAQCVRVTLEVYLAEWFLDERHGTDYETVFADDPPTDTEVEDIMRAAIFQETAVKYIDELTISRDPKSRRIAVSFAGRLESGQSISVEVGA